MSHVLPNPYGVFESGLKLILPENLLVCSEILPDLEMLKSVISKAGFSLKIESAFRSFDRQLSIWNRKAKGELPLLSAEEILIKKIPESKNELMKTILLWSALPGTSRHHFGTDIDVSDANAIPKNYEVQLTKEECTGMFAPFHNLLSELIETGKSFGFARVFVPGRGKIQPEMWHLSHLPTARKIQESFSLIELRKILEKTDIACKEEILDNLPGLMDDYVYPYFI